MNVNITLDDVRAAAERIRSGIYYSPCAVSEPLSLATGCRIHCKLDYLQRTGSFKERGARNALMQLNAEQRRRGVVAASAGNHALGLAYHGQLLNIPVSVVMPLLAPMTKVNTCRQLGATVLVQGEDFAAAAACAHQLEHDQGMTYVHGYDDPAVIAGQGTMALEILEQVPDVEAIIVPVGGAGLIAGIALVIKTLKPMVKIYGVEPRRAASYTAAIKAGKPVPIEVTPTLADGLAVPCVGINAFAIARDRVDRMITVGERDVALAVLRLAELEKGVVEGAGAAPLAALLCNAAPELEGRKVVIPLCGGNIDMPVLGRIIERGLAADGRLCRFDAGISDRPGGLAKLASLIAAQGASIRDVLHERAFAGEDMASVNVHCVVETRDADHIRRLRDCLIAEGFPVRFQDLP